MCPTAFLAPTLTAKTCFICTQPQNAFFLAQLALQGNRANGEKSLPGRVPGPKKGTKMVPKSGSFQEEFFLLSGQKSPKNWTGPCLSLNMVRRKRFIKWQTPSRNANLRLKVRTQRRPAQCSSGDRLPERRSYHVLWGALDLRVTKLYFLAPTLTAKTCFICTQPQNAFFLAQLALQGNRANGKKSLPGRVPGPKKGTKWFQNLGRFKKNSSCSVAKKSPKNWTGPCLSLNMVRRTRFIKWQTPSRNAKSSFEGANPTPPSPMQQWRPPARTTIVSRTVGGLGSEGDKTVLLGPKNWNPISSSKCTVLARHG